MPTSKTNQKPVNRNQRPSSKTNKELKKVENNVVELKPAIAEAVVPAIPKLSETANPVVGGWYEFEDGTVKQFENGPTPEQVGSVIAEVESKEAEYKQEEKELSKDMPAEQAPDLVHVDLVKSNYTKTPSGYKHQVKIKVEEGVILDILEYGGYITDVRVFNTEGKEIYRSEKMSLKDTLQHLGYVDERFKSAKRQIVDIRKAAKKAAEEAPVQGPAEAPVHVPDESVAQ